MVACALESCHLGSRKFQVNVTWTQRKTFWAGCASPGFLERSPRFGIESWPRTPGWPVSGCVDFGRRFAFLPFRSVLSRPMRTGPREASTLMAA